MDEEVPEKEDKQEEAEPEKEEKVEEEKPKPDNKPEKTEENKEPEKKKGNIQEAKEKVKKDKFEKMKKYKNNLTDKMRENPWIASTFLLGIFMLVIITTTFSGMTGGTVSERDIGDLALDFFNNKLSNNPGTLESIEEVSGIYKIEISVENQETFPLYFTKNGEWISQGGELIPITEQIPSDLSDSQDIPKSDIPKVELFVMSFCPFGNRAEDTMLPVYNLLKDNVDWGIHYIVSIEGSNINSLHGQPEVEQNEREACVLNEYGLNEWWKFTTYVNENCGYDGICWEDAVKEANLDINKIKTCVSDKGLDLMKQSEEASNAAEARGSPTLLINGVKSDVVYQYENPEAYKEAICSAFNKPPKECEEKLGGNSSPSGAGGSC